MTVQSEPQGRPYLYWALGLALLFHGGLLVNQSFVRTYDALIHIFFASHYAQNWFDPWETRWYTGFFTIAYPPLSHQLIAVFSFVIGLKAGFALVQLLAVLILIVGVYRTSSLLFPGAAAGYASLAAVISSAIIETVHVFGQLPTTLSLGLLLNAIPWVWAYVRYGQRLDFLRAIAFTAATTAAHHITTIFGSVFFVAPILLILWLEAYRIPRVNEPQRWRWAYRIAPRTYRALLYMVFTVVSLVVVILPYLYWSRTDPILQVPIPHASRDSFLVNTSAGLMFFLIPWLSTGGFFLYALYKGFSTWTFPVALSLGLLALLGTGGTTPLPKMILRGAFDILTLERFTFWACIWMLPFVGSAIHSALQGRLAVWFDANFGGRIRAASLVVFVVAMLASAIYISSLTNLRKFQPEPIEITPIINFIEKDEHWRYRYLTIGFGDQMAWLSANTKAQTVDGNYHSARRLIELTSTPVERLDGAKYAGVPGLGSLEQFVTMPERFHLKFIFANDAFYDPLLYFSGWQRLTRLENGIVVWEREDIAPLPERTPRKNLPTILAMMWGIFPPLSVCLVILSLWLRRLPSWNLARLSPLVIRTWLFERNPTDAPASRPPWMKRLPALNRVLNFQRRQMWVRAARVGIPILGVMAVLLVYFARQPSPEETVLRYWDAYDFRRFQAAYAQLEPQNGLTYERWLLDLSIVGGLRSGYAKLDRIETKVLSNDGTRALVRTRLFWVTSLFEKQEEITDTLVKTARGNWRILAYPALKPRSVERFSEDANVAYYRAARRLTTNTTSSFDVLDRPQLAVGQSRLVRYSLQRNVIGLDGVSRIIKEPTLAVVGEIENLDPRPADVTLTAILRDQNGQELTRNNAATLMQHKLLPGERTAFRVDFIGVDAPKALEAVKSVEIIAKAVVTGHDLERSLATWVKRKQQNLQLEVSNVGASEIAIPQILTVLHDKQGVAWLSADYLLESLPPRSQITWQTQLRLPTDYQVLQIIKTQQNSKTATVFDATQEVIRPAMLVPMVHPTLRGYRLQQKGFEVKP